MIETDSIEKKFVIDICESVVLNNDNIPTVDLADLNWLEVYNLALSQKIRPILLIGINRFKIIVPENILRKLRVDVRQIAMFNMNQFRELLKVSKDLENRNVEIIPFKGSILEKKCFNKFGSREIRDIDFLINPKDLEIIDSVFLSNGYKKQFENVIVDKKYLKFNIEFNYNFHNYQGKRLFHVEPHWYLGFRHLSLDIDFNQIKTLTNPEVIFKENKINVLGPEGMLLTTAIHHVRDFQFDLKKIIDIAMICESHKDEMDWEKVLAKSIEWKVRNMLLLILGLSRKYIDYFLPNEITQLINLKISSSLIISANKVVFSGWNRGVKRNVDNLFFQLRLRQFYRTKATILYRSFFYLINHK